MADNQDLMALLDPKDQQSIDQLFIISDKNLDDKLSKDEFKATMEMLGQTVSDAYISIYWPYLDTNKDGFISKAELVAIAG
jgi:Ca2+-binding EF-hand superfamily protein